MTTYAIGDLQGCLDPLRRLLDKIHFDPVEDRLWFAGDLVNRGRESVACLRFVRELEDAAVMVLGNHDLHLLAMACGVRKHASPELYEVLDTPGIDETLDWLRHQPLLHHDAALDYTVVHAGLPPQWSLAQARVLATEVETVLQAARFESFFADMYGAKPDLWSQNLTGVERLRFIVNAFTRIRFVDAQGRLDFKHKGPPGSQPEGLMPWFEHPERASRNARIVIGHWSALGAWSGHNVFGIDGGCVWGKELLALKLEGQPEFIRVDCRDCA